MSSSYYPVWRPGFFNGNPGIDFDGNNDGLENNSLQILPADGQGTILVVASNELYGASTSYDTLVSFGTDGDDPSLVTNGNNLGLYEDNSTPVNEL